MRRREFIAHLSGAAAVWPAAARAQDDRVRRIGVLMNLAEHDREAPARLAAFRQGLRPLGWIEGGNVRIDIRWAAEDAERYRRHAGELLALAPDILVGVTSPAVAALQQATRTLPIVFVAVIDPVGAGFVASLARPGGNTTGLTAFEYSMAAKWLELLKELLPHMKRVAVLRDATIPAGIAQFAAIQTVAPTFGVELSPLSVRDVEELERALATFARDPNGGLIVTASPAIAFHRALIRTLAARHKLPALYPFRHYVTDGGLIGYGPDWNDQYRRAADYVDRIFRGAKPSDLPVQQPTKFELIINLKTAQALGVNIPASLLARADEVIE
jgi:putative tryptophan/tyrosine transport system substrate-binding protein